VGSVGARLLQGGCGCLTPFDGPVAQVLHLLPAELKEAINAMAPQQLVLPANAQPFSCSWASSQPETGPEATYRFLLFGLRRVGQQRRRALAAQLPRHVVELLQEGAW
jgi:hypothetical protein